MIGESFPLQWNNNLTAVLGQSNSFSSNMMYNNSVSANWPNMGCFKLARNVNSASEKTEQTARQQFKAATWPQEALLKNTKHFYLNSKCNGSPCLWLLERHDATAQLQLSDMLKKRLEDVIFISVFRRIPLRGRLKEKHTTLQMICDSRVCFSVLKKLLWEPKKRDNALEVNMKSELTQFIS